MSSTENRTFVRAPIDYVWETTNDLRLWPQLFTEYESVEVLDDGPPVRFRLTTRPDADQRTWTWESERRPDRSTWTVVARRRETGPFEHMDIRWDFRPHADGTIMRWRQDFAMKHDAPFSDGEMLERLNATSAEQMVAVGRSVEDRYHGGVGPGGPETVSIHDAVHAQRLLTLTCGARLARLVETVTERRVAQALTDGPLDLDELARRTGSHPGTLHRVLRALATVGVFTEASAGRFENTPLSCFLLEDHPYSLAPLVRHSASRMIADPYGGLGRAVITGERQAETTLGSDVWSFLEANPEDAAQFDATMTRLGAWETDEHVTAIEPSRFSEIIDMGGGRGAFLSACLLAAPAAQGLLVENERVTAEAEALLAARGVSGRARVEVGDAFSGPPRRPVAHRAVIFKAVLHNWDDEAALRALAGAADAIDDSGRVFLIEQVLAPGDVFDHAKWLDLDMMLTFGGRERTDTDWRDLLRRAGLRLVGAPAVGRWGVLECERTPT